jgi:hypothetical protein
MKTYTVIWTANASAALANLWNSNPAIRTQITQAADHLDQVLRVRPGDLGEPTSATHRQAVAFPLRVLYAVSEDDRTVRVIYVKHWCD